MSTTDARISFERANAERPRKAWTLLRNFFFGDVRRRVKIIADRVRAEMQRMESAQVPAATNAIRPTTPMLRFAQATRTKLFERVVKCVRWTKGKLTSAGNAVARLCNQAMANRVFRSALNWLCWAVVLAVAAAVVCLAIQLFIAILALSISLILVGLFVLWVLWMFSPGAH